MPAKPLSYITFYLAVFLTCFTGTGLYAQIAKASGDYLLNVHVNDKDSSFNIQALQLQTSFINEGKVSEYIKKLPGLLAVKGYPAASVDSTWSLGQVTHISLYLGSDYQVFQLNTGSIEKRALQEIGFLDKRIANKPVSLLQIQQLQQKLLQYYQRNGYPFASVYLDSIEIQNDRLQAVLRSDKSVLYHVDSIRVLGKAVINNRFLRRYLDLPNGSIYNSEKLAGVDKRLIELPYLTLYQPSDVTMLGTGSVLNLYLQPRKSSQVNFLVGFLPSGGTSGKLQLTGDVNLDLKNLLGGGESILLKWQQLQKKSPRLNLGFNQPYLFNTRYGLDFLFDLFKKDSSFLQVNAQAGASYSFSNTLSSKLFLQFQNTNLLPGGVDTNNIKSTKQLPPNIDVNSVDAGLQFDLHQTDYKFNPRKGNELISTVLVGIKKTKSNSLITDLRDPNFNYKSLYDSVQPRSYQLRLKLQGARYFPIGNYAAFKAGLSGGAFFSPGIFRNELFQLGGHRLLRGFDEESIYASRYLVATAEYRILVSQNSYIFFFGDAGSTKTKYQQVDSRNFFLGTGIGLLFETKVGLLNTSFALGKRNDVPFNLREAAKLHFGYINYF